MTPGREKERDRVSGQDGALHGAGSSYPQAVRDEGNGVKWRRQKERKEGRKRRRSRGKGERNQEKQ